MNLFVFRWLDNAPSACRKDWLWPGMLRADVLGGVNIVIVGLAHWACPFVSDGAILQLRSRSSFSHHYPFMCKHTHNGLSVNISPVNSVKDICLTMRASQALPARTSTVPEKGEDGK